MRSKKAIKNVITSLIQQFIKIICGFIIPRAILGTFGSNVNGLVNSITQFLAYITLLESGFGPVVKSILYKPIAKKDKKSIEKILKSTEKFFRIIAIIFIVYILILCILYPMFVSNEFSRFYTISLILIIGIATFAEYFFGITYKIYLQSEQKTYVISIIQILTTIANTVITIILIKVDAEIQIVKLASSIIFVLGPIIQNIYVRKKYNINLNNKDIENYEIKQKWDGLAQHIAGVIHGNTDITILTFFSDLKEVSVYSVYNLVISGVKNIITVLSSALDAAFGDMLAKGENENFNKKFNMYEFIYFTIITIVYACTITLIVPFIKVYTKGINDIEYARIAFAYIIVSASYIHSIKTPYNNLAYTVGKFKETRKRSMGRGWIEFRYFIIIS